MTTTLDELITRLVQLRGSSEDAGSWVVVAKHETDCLDVTNVEVGECISGTVVEIWFDDEA